jgi:excisionase family DNA binding protein
MAEMKPIELLAVNQVAEYLGIGRSRAYELVKRGEIPSLKLSRRRTRVFKQDFEAWILSHQREEERR